MKSFNNFYLIFFLIVISSLPFIGLYSSKHFILHDTLQKFQIYSLFASSLKEFGTLPLFNPFYDWGISTSLDNIFGIGVAQYISMALSLLFPSIENELVFYVFSLQLNWIIFLFGFYLINKEMKIPNTANILFLFFFGSINSYRNHNFNKLKKDYKIYSSSSFLTNEQRFFLFKEFISRITFTN
mgnify:CR=1 FL=1